MRCICLKSPMKLAASSRVSHEIMSSNSGIEAGPNKDFHVLIVGSGATGLLIAQGLQQAGITVTVFEASTHCTYTDRPRDWTIGLHWGKPFLKEFLSPALLERLPWATTDPYNAATPAEQRGFPILNGKTGEIIAEVGGDGTTRVSRKRIRDLFASGINIRYGKRLVDVLRGAEKVTVHFEDGTSAVGDVLVGADGTQSRVRACILPPELNVLESFPITMYNFGYYFTAEQAKFINSSGHRTLHFAVHPERPCMLMIAPLDVPADEDGDWTFQLMLSFWRGPTEQLQLPTSEERLAVYKEMAGAFCEPFHSVGKWLKGDANVSADRILHMPGLTRWKNPDGRVTLAGDAAHPISPHRGQGLNNAMLDASKYIHTIRDVVAGKTTLVAGMEAYDADVVARGQSEIMTSGQQTFATHHYDILMESPMVKNGTRKLKAQTS